MKGHHVVIINDFKEARHFLEEIGVDNTGKKFMMPKAIHYCIKLKDISSRLANIIKQEMLSKGGEAAVAKHSINAEFNTDVLLMGTVRQYELLIEKLKIQPFKKLRELAKDIDVIIKALEPSVTNMELANNKTLTIGEKTLVMGILNTTPDSFSDGGRFVNPELAIRHAMEMIEQGADIIDVGGASSRPNSNMADEDEELKRVLPVVKRLAKENTIISVDTFRAKVAEEVLANGAHIINDIGRLKLDSQLIKVVTKYNAPIILMHNRLQMQKDEPYLDLISDIIKELNESINIALENGLDINKIIIDPGIGFGKTVTENRIIIKRLKEFKSLGRPILLGASRKSFIGKTLNLEVNERLEGSLAVAALGIVNGADILRVHDVKETKRVVMMVDAVIGDNG